MTLGDIINRAARSAPMRAILSRAVRVSRRVPIDVGTSGFAAFLEYLRQLNGGMVLELGTRRVAGAPSTIRRHWFPEGVRYIGSDFMPGQDVDVVADIECLSQTFAPSSIDAVIACSVFEHIRRPWLAAAEIGKVLRPGARAFIQTHNAFPIHAHPHDYWRFSREALETLFSEECGFCDQQSWYEYPAMIVSGETPLLAVRPSFLNVCIVATKRAS